MYSNLRRAGMLAIAVGLAPACFAGSGENPAALRRHLADSVARGDMPAALALYADDAVIEGGGRCRLEPCVGKAAIALELADRIARKPEVQTLGSYVSGNVLTTHLKVMNDATRLAGVDHFTVWVIYEARNGKLASERILFERSDPETMRFYAWLSLQ